MQRHHHLVATGQRGAVTCCCNAIDGPRDVDVTVTIHVGIAGPITRQRVRSVGGRRANGNDANSEVLSMVTSPLTGSPKSIPRTASLATDCPPTKPPLYSEPVSTTTPSNNHQSDKSGSTAPSGSKGLTSCRTKGPTTLRWSNHHRSNQRAMTTETVLSHGDTGQRPDRVARRVTRVTSKRTSSPFWK